VILVADFFYIKTGVSQFSCRWSKSNSVTIQDIWCASWTCYRLL